MAKLISTIREYSAREYKVFNLDGSFINMELKETSLNHLANPEAAAKQTNVENDRFWYSLAECEAFISMRSDKEDLFILNVRQPKAIWENDMQSFISRTMTTRQEAEAKRQEAQRKAQYLADKKALESKQRKEAFLNSVNSLLRDQNQNRNLDKAYPQPKEFGMIAEDFTTEEKTSFLEKYGKMYNYELKFA